MRTKLILTTAAFGVASIGALAQVYSVNAVGYINITVPANQLILVANQLNAGGNTLPEVIPAPPDGTQVFKFSPGAGFATYGYEGEWLSSTTIAPGDGFFLKSPTATTITLVGEVPQGPLSTPLVAGLNLVSSKVPQAGGLQTVLGYTPADGDQVYQWDVATQNYKPADAYEGEWVDGSEPVIAVGEGFFLSRAAAGSWNRTFSVNQ